MGSGMLGVTAVAWARSAGAAAVIACDTNPTRLDLARIFGATHGVAPGDLAGVVEDETLGHGVDVAIELSGASEAVETLLPLVRLGGVIVLVGSVFPTRPVSIVPEQVVRRSLTIRGVHNYAPRHLDAALDFLAIQRHDRFSGVVAPWRPLSAVNEILAVALTTEMLRIGIRPGER